MSLSNLDVNVVPMGNKLDVTAQGRVGSNAVELVLRRRRRGATLTLSIGTAPITDMPKAAQRSVFTSVQLQQQINVPSGVRTVRVKNNDGNLIETIKLS